MPVLIHTMRRQGATFAQSWHNGQRRDRIGRRHVNPRGGCRVWSAASGHLRHRTGARAAGDPKDSSACQQQLAGSDRHQRQLSGDRSRTSSIVCGIEFARGLGSQSAFDRARAREVVPGMKVLDMGAGAARRGASRSASRNRTAGGNAWGVEQMECGVRFMNQRSSSHEHLYMLVEISHLSRETSGSSKTPSCICIYCAISIPAGAILAL
jgi:hypothetical protein